MTNHSNEVSDLFSALVAFRAESPRVSKDGTANYGRYITYDNLVETISPILAKHGLSFTQLVTIADGGSDALTTTIIHKSGQWLSGTGRIAIESNGRLAGAQAQGSAITYAKRYHLGAALGISTDDDDDGAAASRSKQPAKQNSTQSAGGPDIATRAKLHAVLGDNYESVIAYRS